MNPLQFLAVALFVGVYETAGATGLTELELKKRIINTSRETYLAAEDRSSWKLHSLHAVDALSFAKFGFDFENAHVGVKNFKAKLSALQSLAEELGGAKVAYWMTETQGYKDPEDPMPAIESALEEVEGWKATQQDRFFIGGKQIIEQENLCREAKNARDCSNKRRKAFCKWKGPVSSPKGNPGRCMTSGESQAEAVTLLTNAAWGSEDDFEITLSAASDKNSETRG